jgi:hypothetical protein
MGPSHGHISRFHMTRTFVYLSTVVQCKDASFFIYGEKARFVEEYMIIIEVTYGT